MKKLLQGHYELNMNCAEFDILIQESVNRVARLSNSDMSGTPVLPVDEFMKTPVIGFCFICSDSKDQVIGLGCKDAELSRIWIAPTGDGKHTLYFDAPVTMVEQLGLLYESATGNIISPFNANKIILSGTDYK